MSNNNIDFLKLLLDLSIGESARSSTRLAPFIIVQSVLIGFTLTAVFNPQSNIYATVLILIPPILGIVIAILHGSTIKTSKYYNHIWSNGARKWIKTIKSGNISISDHNQAQTDFLSKILDYRINSLWVKHDPSDDKETKKRLVVTLIQR